MEVKEGAFGNIKLLKAFLSPSWLSTSLAIGIGVGIVVLTIILTHVGGTVQQSLTGLHNSYSDSSIGNSIQTDVGNIAQNSVLNNALLFLLWGSVGIIVYSIVRSVAKEFGDADNLMRELKQVHANRHSILVSATGRSIVRILALVAWFFIFHFFAFKLIPYTIAAAHVVAQDITNTTNWSRCLLYAFACMLCVQLLAVLLRLATMRVRVFGNTYLYS